MREIPLELMIVLQTCNAMLPKNFVIETNQSNNILHPSEING